MSNTNENIEQVKAIRTIDNNVVVNAGAGTGKTKVLTDRYIEILKHGNLKENEEIESIVAITFTNKATQEMIERIRALIQDEIKTDNSQKWNRFYRDMEKSNISTIHGFCGDILRENPVEANIDPYFQIADEIESSSLLSESIFEVISNYLDSRDEFINLLDIYESDRIDGFIADFMALYNQVRTYGVEFEDIRLRLNNYIDSLEYSDEDLIFIKNIVTELVKAFRSNSKLVKYSKTEDYFNFMSSKYEKDIYDYLTDIVDNLGTSKVEVELQDKLIERIQKVMLSKELEYKWAYNLVIDILKDIDQLYSEKKRKEGILDYDDLQIKVLELLENKTILENYQKRYKYYLIDEFQDTNELQKKIFYKLTSKESPLDMKNLFVVGDPKQSIYGFRGANVNIFYDVIDEIEKNYDKDNIITLKTNYRSVDTVMEFVNITFANAMGVKYDRLDSFHKSSNDIDIEVIYDEDLEVGEDYEFESDTHYEAEVMCRRIVELLDEGYKYKDMAVLFRSTGRIFEYEDILRKYNIPFHNSTSKSFYLNQEIVDLIVALKVIKNQNDKLSFIGLLRSPMFGLNDDSIFKIMQEAKASKNDDMLSSIKNIISEKELDESLHDKLNRAYEIIVGLIEVKKYLNIVDLVNEVIDKTDYIPSCLLKDDGEQKAANVYKFKDLTQDYYTKNNGTLDDYIDYLEDARSRDESEETTISESDDVVKLMTIHASKGLQFKVVFLPQMSSTVYNRTPKFFYNEELGLSIKNGISNGIYDQNKKTLDDIEKEELLRVYYVAMTRAESLLILGLQGRNSGIKKELLEHIPELRTRVLEGAIEVKDENNKMSVMEDISKEVDGGLEEFPLLVDIESDESNDSNLYSITQFMTFNECRRKYFLKYIWDINLDLESKENVEEQYLTGSDEKDEKKLKGVNYLRASTKGNIIHEFCKVYRPGMDIDNLLKESISKFTDKHVAQSFKMLYPYVKNYINWYNSDYDEIYYEKPFYSKLNHGYLYGIIDRINIKSDKIDIIDFKTNKVDGDNMLGLNEYYRPQILTYAYVAKEILKKELNFVGLVYLENNQEVDYDVSIENLESNINKVDDFMGFVNSHNRIEDYEMSSTCNENCEHIELCKRFI